MNSTSLCSTRLNEDMHYVTLLVHMSLNIIRRHHMLLLALFVYLATLGD